MSTTSSHTPGPWMANISKQMSSGNDEPGHWAITVGIQNNAEYAGDFIRVYPANECLGGDHISASKALEVAKADAHLIASAPDLLEALERVTGALENWMEIAEEHDRRDSDYEAVNAAMTAIRKAKGE